MNVEIEEKIEEEILRRALKRSHIRQQEKEKVLYTQDMLDALQEITGLPCAELEKIAEEVRSSYLYEDEGLFSIKYQLIFVGIFVLIVLSIPILGIWLF
ncbi:MAG: hypothetical protein JSW15_11565 [Deltaproteobacteria bacterium]|nr:MAG: hypothetical protein JSW15_11565 [Deltaproteobacteria bacterium]